MFQPGCAIAGFPAGQGQISGSCFSKDGCFGGISVSQTHLVFLCPKIYANYGSGKEFKKNTRKLLCTSARVDYSGLQQEQQQ